MNSERRSEERGAITLARGRHFHIPKRAPTGFEGQLRGLGSTRGTRGRRETYLEGSSDAERERERTERDSEKGTRRERNKNLDLDKTGDGRKKKRLFSLFKHDEANESHHT